MNGVDFEYFGNSVNKDFMKILMVCLGNICRSPIAHGVMQRMADEKGLDWTVRSAGTGSWHVGEPPDRRAIAAAKQFGTDISRQRAEHFSRQHFADYDHIFAMDKNNLRNILSLAANEEERLKVKLFLEDGEVPDPYYDSEMFTPVYEMVEERCRELVEELEQ